MLAYSGVIAVAEASVAMPVEAFVYSGIAWIKTVSLIAECVHEARKLHDEEYHLSTIRTKEATVGKKRGQLEYKLTNDDLSNDAKENIKAKIAKLQEEEKGLQAKATMGARH